MNRLSILAAIVSMTLVTSCASHRDRSNARSKQGKSLPSELIEPEVRPRHEKRLPDDSKVPIAPVEQEESLEEILPPSILRKRIQSSTVGRLILDEESNVDLFEWNHRIPSTIPQWIQLLGEGTGKVSGLLIPFSMAPPFASDEGPRMVSSLEGPRIVLTAPEGSKERGRFFIGIPEGDADSEFISWNIERRAFDFGFIKSHNGKRKISFAKEAKCFSCHQTRSPIFPDATWDNTVLNRSVLAAFVETQAKLGTSGFHELNTRLRESRGLREEVFANATYRGFPFVDPDTMQAFDFDEAIFEAHALVVVTDWLQTLPNQSHAAQIAEDGAIDLIELYPEHYKSIATFRSPYLKNFNLVANTMNHFHSVGAVERTRENIEAVLKYNANAKAKGKHELPEAQNPTSDEAFLSIEADWRDYLTEDVIQQVFGESDSEYASKIPSSFHNPERYVPYDKLCVSCHDGGGRSPYPDFSSFNPLREYAWTKLLEEELEEGGEILCDVLSRISSSSAPMPPRGSMEAVSFEPYRSSTITTLRTLLERHQLNCQS